MAPSPRVTKLLQRLDPSDPASEEELFAVVYTELREMASSQLRRERTGHTLQSTDLVHEGYMKLQVDLRSVDWEWNSRRQFFHMAARAMRQVLIDHARRRGRNKRGGGAAHVPLHEVDPSDATALYPEESDAEAELRLAEALDVYAALGPAEGEARDMFQLHYYLGLSTETIGESYEVSARTVRRRLNRVKAFLDDYLSR